MPVELRSSLPQPQVPVKPNKLTGRDVLMMLIGFFGLMTVANMFLVYHALNSWTGLEVPSSYEASQTYQQTLNAAAQQNALGWVVSSGIAKDEAGHVVVTTEIRDRNGAEISDLTATGVLARPTQSGMDQSLTFHKAGEATFVALANDVAAGAWDLRLTFETATGETFHSRNRVLLNPVTE